MTNNLTEALQIIIHYHQPAQKYMHFPRQLNLDKLHRDSLTKHGLTAAASDLVMFLQSGFDVYRYYSKCQAVHNKMHAYFYGKKHAPIEPNIWAAFICVCLYCFIAIAQVHHIYILRDIFWIIFCPQSDHVLTRVQYVGLTNLFHCVFK